MQIDMTCITTILYIKNNHAFQNNNATNATHRCLIVQLLNYSIRIKSYTLVFLRTRGNIFYLMEDAANHAKNDMSEIGHELPKKVTHPKIGFNLYMLNGIFMYCIKRFVSRNNISSMFHALSRNLIYDMFIIIIRNVYFDIELLRL